MQRCGRGRSVGRSRHYETRLYDRATGKHKIVNSNTPQMNANSTEARKRNCPASLYSHFSNMCKRICSTYAWHSMHPRGTGMSHMRMSGEGAMYSYVAMNYFSPTSSICSFHPDMQIEPVSTHARSVRIYVRIFVLGVYVLNLCSGSYLLNRAT